MSDNRRPSSPSARRSILAGACAVAAVLGAGALVAVQLTASDDSQRTATPGMIAPPTPTAPTVADRPATPAGIAGTLTGGPAAHPAAGTGGTAVGLASAPITVRYTFDGGVEQPITDIDGQFPLRAVTVAGGTLVFTPRDAGFAMRFPPRCTRAPRKCPRAILEGARVDALNPGTRPLRYGASVLMRQQDLADGANVLQKGYSVGGVSQFKLQVDHLQGRPSCVIASHGTIYRAEPKINIADGRWHNLVCARRDAQLTVIVDGIPRASVAVPPDVSIANAEPLRIGGKGATATNDQFAGQIDNVFLAIG